MHNLYTVQVLYPPEFVASYSLSEGITIGRGKHCELSLDDEWISRQHCRIWVERDSVWVEDLNSTNGTFVDGQSITKTNVHVGDKIQVGRVMMQIVAADDDEQRTIMLPSFREQAANHNSTYALAVAIPRFEGLVQHFGHEAIAFVVAETSAILESECLSDERLVHLGNGRFMILSLCENDNEAEQLLERVQALLERHRFVWDNVEIPTGFVLTWVNCTPGEDENTIAERAFAGAP